MHPFLSPPRHADRCRNSSEGGDCSHPKAQPVVEKLEPQGDMKLLVGRQKCIDVSCSGSGQSEQPDAICFHVNSTIVAGASPAFDSVLYSPSAEAAGVNDGDGNVKWSAKLPDDDPEAMRTIINILYGRYPVSKPESHMDIEQLRRLTVLADKYNLVDLFPKWSIQWVADMEPYWVNKKFVNKSTEDLESLLWIFWVLGHEPLYTYMVLQMAFHGELDYVECLVDPKDDLCFTNGDEEVPVPPRAIDEIGHVRTETIKMIYDDIEKLLEQHLHGGENEDQPLCTPMNGEDDSGWRRSVHDSLEDMVDDRGIWPPTSSAYTYKGSPRSLIETFRFNPNIPWFVHRYRNDYQGKWFCDVVGTFWEHIERQLSRHYVTLPSADVKHLDEQAAKSGLASHFKAMNTGHSPSQGTWNLREILAFQAATTRSKLANTDSKDGPHCLALRQKHGLPSIKTGK